MARWKYSNKSLIQVASEVAARTPDPEAADILRRMVRQVEEYRRMNRSLSDSLQTAQTRNPLPTGSVTRRWTREEHMRESKQDY